MPSDSPHVKTKTRLQKDHGCSRFDPLEFYRSDQENRSARYKTFGIKKLGYSVRSRDQDRYFIPFLWSVDLNPRNLQLGSHLESHRFSQLRTSPYSEVYGLSKWSCYSTSTAT